MIDINGVIVTDDLFTEHFCCDLAECKGACCVEGDAGAPVTPDEVAYIEELLPTLSPLLSDLSQKEIERNGVCYVDIEGDLVTSIVNDKECVFTGCRCGTTDCVIEREGYTKPLSCSLYPLRMKHFSSGGVGLNYHRWAICRAAREQGKKEGILLYQFLKAPLIKAFGEAWYAECCNVAKEISLRNDNTHSTV